MRPRPLCEMLQSGVLSRVQCHSSWWPAEGQASGLAEVGAGGPPCPLKAPGENTGLVSKARPSRRIREAERGAGSRGDVPTPRRLPHRERTFIKTTLKLEGAWERALRPSA